ncbi:glycosyltransferase family 1 protein [bacterium]|nr:MAG: glycosyltransferase family 1 protein [bacterium]
MKIGINATFLNEKPTGVGIFTKEISTMLCTLNEETVVFTSVKPGDIHERQIHKTPSRVQGSRKLSHNVYRLIYSNTVLPFLIKKRKIEILFCPITEFPLFQSSPLLVTVHDLHPLYFPEQFGLSSSYFKFSLKVLPKWGRRIVVPSRFVKREVLNYLDIKSNLIDIIPPGYDKALFKPLDEEFKKDFLKKYGLEEPFILFVGSLFPYKNIKTLLKTFLEVQGRIPHSLVVAGKIELSQEKLPEHKRIHYLDYVQPKDIPGFYSYADICVHPSLVEGFGMTIVEAMACGTPVISSNGGSLPEVVGEAGILFDPSDSQQLGERLLTVIYNKSLQKEMRLKGFQQVKQYSWERTAKGIVHSCEEALKQSK